MDALRYRALETIVRIAYEIAIGKRGASDTKDNEDKELQERQDA